MATKKAYPFIIARIAEDNEALEGHVITFDAREVAYYHRHDQSYNDKDIVTVGFKSGKEIDMYLKLGADPLYENLFLPLMRCRALTSGTITRTPLRTRTRNNTTTTTTF